MSSFLRHPNIISFSLAAFLFLSIFKSTFTLTLVGGSKLWSTETHYFVIVLPLNWYNSALNIFSNSSAILMFSSHKFLPSSLIIDNLRMNPFLTVDFSKKISKLFFLLFSISCILSFFHIFLFILLIHFISQCFMVSALLFSSFGFCITFCRALSLSPVLFLDWTLTRDYFFCNSSAAIIFTVFPFLPYNSSNLSMLIFIKIN